MPPAILSFFRKDKVISLKSRVINTKHFNTNSHKKEYTQFTSGLKPSLFYGDRSKESYMWLQDFESNKMSRWTLDEEKSTDDIWVYTCDEKFLKKFPHLEGWKAIVTFDTVKGPARRRKKWIQSRRAAGLPI